jgi:DNA repair photolyase
MSHSEIEAKSILRKHKKIDSWFLSHYGMNLYRGCTHNCIYCDGRAESYYVDGNFGDDIVIKINAPALLNKELDPQRKRKPFDKGFFLLGGGVCDTYQPLEKKYCLTRQALQIFEKFHHPVHILTKSVLIERDVDLLQKINEKTHVIVSFSFSSVDDELSAIFEPGVPSPSKRLITLATLKKLGISCGMFLLPVIPFVTDTPDKIENAVKSAKEIGIDFIIFGGLTLKEGQQKKYFFNAVEKFDSSLFKKIYDLFPENKWGKAQRHYSEKINNIFFETARKYRMPVRIPLSVFRNILSEKDLVVVILEHLDYYLRCEGKNSSFGYAAYSLSQIKTSISDKNINWNNISGVDRNTKKIIFEILETGTSSNYQKFVNGFGIKV